MAQTPYELKKNESLLRSCCFLMQGANVVTSSSKWRNRSNLTENRIKHQFLPSSSILMSLTDMMGPFLACPSWLNYQAILCTCSLSSVYEASFYRESGDYTSEQVSFVTHTFFCPCWTSQASKASLQTTHARFFERDLKDKIQASRPHNVLQIARNIVHANSWPKYNAKRFLRVFSYVFLLQCVALSAHTPSHYALSDPIPELQLVHYPQKEWLFKTYTGARGTLRATRAARKSML